MISIDDIFPPHLCDYEPPTPAPYPMPVLDGDPEYPMVGLAAAMDAEGEVG